MQTRRVFLAAALLAFVAGCASVPKQDIQIEAQADPKARFSGYKSYEWLGSAGIMNDPEGKWKSPGFDADQEIKFLIDRELRRRGMSEDSAGPDLYVAFALGVDMEALKLRQDPQTKMDVLTNVPQGGLVVVLVDSQTGLVIWAGVAQGEVQQQHANTTTAKARLDYAVTEMMKKIPK
jgi:hypothetical protein